MNANETIRNILRREGVSAERAALSMGKSKSYLTALLARQTDPRMSTMVSVCDSMGYELVARSRDDGFEFVIDE